MAVRSLAPEYILEKFQCNVKEASVLVGLSPSRIYNLIHEKRLPFPFYRVGNAIRFRVSEILEYLEGCKVNQAA
jgi:excisionase family DNA binding protein